MLESVKELPVWPGSVEPSLAHWKLNGPVPWAAVLKLAVSPGQLVSETKASAVVGTLTVRLAEVGMLFHTPATRPPEAPPPAAGKVAEPTQPPLRRRRRRTPFP